jgi:hypothetical protein
MVHVLSRRRWGARLSWTGLLGVLAGSFLLLDSSLAMGQAAAKKARPPAPAEQDAPKAKDAAEEKDQDAAPAPDASAAAAADPSQTRRVAPIEVFKDDIAEALNDPAKIIPLPAVPFAPNELAQVKEMAANPNLNFDRVIVDRVVRAQVAKLTDKKNILALLETPEEDPKAAVPKKGAAPKKPSTDGGKAIEEATMDLLDPIFRARGSKNDQFLSSYRRILNQYLPPLLKNHLVPRVQAMIVLGEAASPESLGVFQNEIANRNQALWVKLWAIEGISNIIKKGGSRLSADQESKAARTISDFLEKQKELPWPIQFRALEALGSLRQGSMPTAASQAHMANAAMAFLADSDGRIELRSEAARTMGLMHVTAPRYNFRLIAYCAGQLAADLASQLNDQYTAEKPAKVDNPTRAKYLAALLVGPVSQCFEGVSGENVSGLLQLARNDPDSLKYVQSVFDLVKQVSQASVNLLFAPPLQYKEKKQTLALSVAKLQKYLEKNPPPSRKLVDKGPEFGGGNNAAGAQLAPPAQPLAGLRRGR